MSISKERYERVDIGRREVEKTGSETHEDRLTRTQTVALLFTHTHGHTR